MYYDTPCSLLSCLVCLSSYIHSAGTVDRDLGESWSFRLNLVHVSLLYWRCSWLYLLSPPPVEFVLKNETQIQPSTLALWDIRTESTLLMEVQRPPWSSLREISVGVIRPKWTDERRMRRTKSRITGSILRGFSPVVCGCSVLKHPLLLTVYRACYLLEDDKACLLDEER